MSDPAMTADELAGWKAALYYLELEARIQQDIVSRFPNHKDRRAQRDAATVARDAVAARIAAMAQEEQG